MYQVYVEIVGGCNSLDLWSCVSTYKVNVIDLGNKIYVHGKVTPTTFLSLVQTCLQFGTLEVEIIKL